MGAPKITVNCEADCSAGVCANVTVAGYLLGIKALQNHTGTYTGNMRSALTKAGFQLLTDSKYLTSGDYLLPGDILLNDGHHSATNVTIGKKSTSEWKPGATIAPVTPYEPAPVITKYYRVRKSWTEKSSQIGAFTVFQNAKNCVDANPGYAAFDDNGNQVYPAVAQTFAPYLVKVSIDDLNYRKEPSTSYASWGISRLVCTPLWMNRTAGATQGLRRQAERLDLPRLREKAVSAFLPSSLSNVIHCNTKP